MTDKYVRVPVEGVEKIAEMRDTAMRNIEISPTKYSADWAEVAQLLDWLCGEIEAAPSVDIKQCPECAGLGVFAADHNFPCPECSGMGLVEHVRQAEPESAEPVSGAYYKNGSVHLCTGNGAPDGQPLYLHPPAQQWINCSERMPEIGVPVRCQLRRCSTGEVLESSLIHVNEGDCSWRTADDNSEISYEFDVVSWKPLPPGEE